MLIGLVYHCFNLLVFYVLNLSESDFYLMIKPPPTSLRRGRKCKPIFVQIARQVVKLNASDLRLPSRAWKVKLVGEGADDAGGVFDDTITEMCQVRIQELQLLSW